MSTHDPAHWDAAWSRKAPEEQSWFHPDAAVSLSLIDLSGVRRDAPVIDIGGGATTLAAHLLDRGFTDVSVLDISEVGLAHARERLGERAGDVTWIAGDVTETDLDRRYALWHDRAVFHFLVEPDRREAYRQVLRRSLAPGGSVVLAAFAPQGPDRCSGLPVERYAAAALCNELGPDLTLVEHLEEIHRTPAGASQAFTWVLLRRAVSTSRQASGWVPGRR